MKTIFKKSLSILTLVSIVLSILAALTLVSVAASGAADILGLYDDDDYQNLIDQWILSESGMSAEEFIATYYEDYYDYISSDYWGLAAGSGGVYGSDNNFNDAYLEATEQQLAMFFAGNGLPFKWDEFVIYAKNRRAAELSSSSFSTSDYVGSNNLTPVSISGEGIKALYSPWADYYKPMPTTTQYTWSYQSTESTTTSCPYLIGSCDCPLYMQANGSWGKKNWSGVYFLPFVIDDDFSYYARNYIHFYSTKSDSTVTLHFDYYDLATGELVSEGSNTWDAANKPYLGLQFTGESSGGVYIRQYTSYSDYMCMAYNDCLRNYLGFGDIISYNYSTSTARIYSLLQSVSFTPHTNKNDDWGYYLSSEPFQLFSNQTSIDFDQIPDNYVITINGDTIYDYSITNPATGDTSTVNYYVTNNYTLPNNGNNESDSGSSSGTSSGDVNVGGNVTVSGDVNVGGEISIKADPIDINVNTQPIDINVNVTGGGSGGSSSSDVSGVQFDEDVSLNNYYDWMTDQTSGFSSFMSNFFSWLPTEIVVMLCAGFACVILMRFLGR